MPDASNYTIGWICALATDLVAARAFLDEEYPLVGEVLARDENSYTLGRIGEHYIVIAVLPSGECGTNSAASVARDMLHSFGNIKVGLMVGTGGGAPSSSNDIRLGDIVVSSPSNRSGGVLQYDYGKTMQTRKFECTAFLGQPPKFLRTAVNKLKAIYEADGHQLVKAVDDAIAKKPRLGRNYKRPDPSTDKLYRAHIMHVGTRACNEVCGDDISKIVERPARKDIDDGPMIHYGLIASANQVMKDALFRDILIKEENILCFEMEAAGLMNHFPCLVVRGICSMSLQRGSIMIKLT
jgi:nucleoside phosphorylase